MLSECEVYETSMGDAQHYLLCMHQLLHTPNVRAAQSAVFSLHTGKILSIVSAYR